MLIFCPKPSLPFSQNLLFDRIIFLLGQGISVAMEKEKGFISVQENRVLGWRKDRDEFF